MMIFTHTHKTSGMQSSFLDQSMVSHAAVRVGVKLVYCPPSASTRPASLSVQSGSSHQSNGRDSVGSQNDKVDSEIENIEGEMESQAAEVESSPIITPPSPPAPMTLPFPPIPLATSPKDDDKDLDMYIAPSAEQVLSPAAAAVQEEEEEEEVEKKLSKKEVKRREQEAERESAMSFDNHYSSANAGIIVSKSGKEMEKIVSYSNPMFRPTGDKK
jgi:hypothetical protein